MGLSVDTPDTQLRKFRATHAYKQRDVAGVPWEYILCGQGKDTLLLLPGAHGLGEVAFQVIMKFEHTYRVISPSYPSNITTLAGLVDGLADILTAEDIHRVFVVGGSFSGMVAQHLVRRYPERVSKLILDHAGIPKPERAKTYAMYHTIFSALPLTLIRTMLNLGKYFYLRHMYARDSSGPWAFWNTYFGEIIATLTKEDYLNRIHVCIDFDRHSILTSQDLQHWPGSMLIIEADDDAYVPLQEREALKSLYPQARVYTFHGTSHFAWASELEAFLDVIEHFLQESS